MIENIIMSSHAPQINVNGLIVVYRVLAFLIKWWCSSTGNRTPTIQTTGRRLSTHGHPSGPAPCLFSIMIGPTHCVLCTTCCSSILLAIYYNELYYRNLLAAPARVKALFIVPLHIRRVYIFHVPYDHQTRNPPRYTYYMLLVVSHCTMNHSLILLDL